MGSTHLTLEPGVPSFGEFQTGPSDHSLNQKADVCWFQGETGDKVTPAPICLTDRPYAPAAAGDLGEPAIVRANEKEERKGHAV